MFNSKTKTKTKINRPVRPGSMATSSDKMALGANCCQRATQGDKWSRSGPDNDSALLNKLILITVEADYGEDFSETGARMDS